MQTINLKMIKTVKKNGSFVYTILDQDGKEIASRSSNREYYGAVGVGYYFEFAGRPDLLAKLLSKKIADSSSEHFQRFYPGIKSLNVATLAEA